MATETLRPKSITTPSASRMPGPTTPHFLFDRPLGLDAPAPAPNAIYLYGTTELGQYEVHHGVDFDRNPTGVPVFAVGDGTVVSAGDDRQPLCGEKGQSVCGRFLNFYGLVAVIRLDQSYRGQTLFALYGHMSRLDVQIGQQVKLGDSIGAVGMTGIAIGPHIQFEIRSGANDYASTRNPMLWIAPLPGRGVLAGRYTDAAGIRIDGAIVDVYRAEEPSRFYRETETYSRDEQPDVNSDDELGENWAMNDLPVGEYIVRVPGKQFAQRVSVPAGGWAFVELSLSQ
jgi:murein DD-endopeptidase MepM/ murein hydrolase activator NlpD